MDFAAWIEVYLGGRWHAFDPGAPGLSLQIEELQGDFDRMQGGPKLGPAKSDQISIVWTASPYSRSREDIIFSREEPSRYWSAP
jgi:transglutaminase-like putative cysteine protease